METTLRGPRYESGPALRWAVPAGLGLIIAGLIVLASPLAGALVAVAVFGWMSLFAGAVEVTHAWEARRERHFAWHLLAGALYVGAGFFVLFQPIKGALAVAFALATLLVLRAAVVGAIAWQLRRTRVWALFGLDALLSLALGGVMFAGWPSRALTWLALWLGAGLIVNGLDRLGVAALLRSQNLPRPPPAPGAAAHA